jgi:hypothetical protein
MHRTCPKGIQLPTMYTAICAAGAIPDNIVPRFSPYLYISMCYGKHYPRERSSHTPTLYTAICAAGAIPDSCPRFTPFLVARPHHSSLRRWMTRASRGRGSHGRSQTAAAQWQCVSAHVALRSISRARALKNQFDLTNPLSRGSRKSNCRRMMVSSVSPYKIPMKFKSLYHAHKHT